MEIGLSDTASWAVMERNQYFGHERQRSEAEAGSRTIMACEHSREYARVAELSVATDHVRNPLQATSTFHAGGGADSRRSA
jgi:hypothetical protein